MTTMKHYITTQVAVLNYNDNSVVLLTRICEENANEHIETWLEKHGFKLSEISYMVSDKMIDLRDERDND
jgi:uncharacterized protein YkuJ